MNNESDPHSVNRSHLIAFRPLRWDDHRPKHPVYPTYSYLSRHQPWYRNPNFPITASIRRTRSNPLSPAKSHSPQAKTAHLRLRRRRAASKGSYLYFTIPYPLNILSAYRPSKCLDKTKTCPQKTARSGFHLQPKTALCRRT